MTRTTIACAALAFTCSLLAVANADAHERYNGGCQLCHGDFTEGVSPQGTVFPGDDKHRMHRSSSYMNADCDLCHATGDGNDPFIGSSDGTANNPGIGCSGCHGREEDMGNDNISNGRGAGLRQHHTNAGEMNCVGCHDDADPANYTPVGEDVLPTYYGTVDTNVDAPCNEVAMMNVNENWSDDMDFVGQDNDGNGDYDMADVVCVPEPAQAVMALVGVTFLAGAHRRRGC